MLVYKYVQKKSNSLYYQPSGKRTHHTLFEVFAYKFPRFPKGDTIYKISALVNKNWTLKLYFLTYNPRFYTAIYVSLYCFGIRYPSEYAGRSSLKNIIYVAIFSMMFSPCKWKSVNNSDFIHLLMDSIVALSVGV